MIRLPELDNNKTVDVTNLATDIRFSLADTPRHKAL